MLHICVFTCKAKGFGFSSLIECLLGKFKALGSVSITEKKKGINLASINERRHVVFVLLYLSYFLLAKF